MAIFHLPEPRLVDAAYIFIGANDRLEQPVISNGLTVSEDRHCQENSLLNRRGSA